MMYMMLVDDIIMPPTRQHDNEGNGTYLPHRSSSVCVVYWEGWERLLVNSCNINGALLHRCCIIAAIMLQ